MARRTPESSELTTGEGTRGLLKNSGALVDEVRQQNSRVYKKDREPKASATGLDEVRLLADPARSDKRESRVSSEQALGRMRRLLTLHCP